MEYIKYVEDWNDYLEPNRLVAVYYPDVESEDWDKAVETIVTLKAYGFHLLVMQLGKGYARFRNGELVDDSGLGKQIMKWKERVWMRRSILPSYPGEEKDLAEEIRWQ